MENSNVMNTNTESNLEWIFNWFYNQCDGDWEHGKGIKIGTLSNPGWFIKIDLNGTDLEDKPFKKIFIERTENDWIFCDRRNGFFEGDCGPFNLPEIVHIFRSWAETSEDQSK